MKDARTDRGDHQYIGFWAPKTLVAILDRLVSEGDSDRSKFIRAALKEKLGRKKGSSK